MNGHDGGPNIGSAERVVSVLGGVGLATEGIRQTVVKDRKAGLLLAVAGGYLVYRGLSGRCAMYRMLGASPEPRFLSNPLSRDIVVHKAITIGRPASELYAFWRNLTNLPRIMRHVQSVEVLDNRRSRWTVQGPGGASVEWEANIIEERENEYLAWSTMDGSSVKHAGCVTFEQAPAGRGAIVRVILTYRPTAGAVGALVAKMFRREPAQEIHDDLRRFKQMMETGEVATNISPAAREIGPPAHPPAAMMPPGQPRRRREQPRALDWHAENEPRRGKVEIASEDSFPASDAPAWTSDRQSQNRAQSPQ